MSSNDIPQKIRAAKAKTSAALPHRGNVVDDLISTRGSSHVILSDFVRNNHVSGVDKPREYGVGNCGENSADLFRELRATDITLPIFKVSYPHQNTDHAFNLVGDPRIQHPYIADTWTNRDNVVPQWNERNISVFPDKTSLARVPNKQSVPFGPSMLHIDEYAMPNSSLPSPTQPVVKDWSTLQLENKMRVKLQSRGVNTSGMDDNATRNNYVQAYNTPGTQNMWANYNAYGSSNQQGGLLSPFQNRLGGKEYHPVRSSSGSVMDSLGGLPSPYGVMDLYRVSNPAQPPIVQQPVFQPFSMSSPSSVFSSGPSMFSSPPTLQTQPKPPQEKRAEKAPDKVDPFRGLFEQALKKK